MIPAISGRFFLPGLALLLLLALPPAVPAQTVRVKDWNKEGDTLEGALGLHYGKLGGNGLSLRLPVTWYLYLQLGGGVWHTESDQKHNLGVQLDYILRQDAHLRLYVAGGVGYFYHREKVGQSAGVDQWDKDEDYYVGGGVGLEYLLGPRVAVQGEFDFIHDSDKGEVKVYPQVGIHYYW